MEISQNFRGGPGPINQISVYSYQSATLGFLLHSWSAADCLTQRCEYYYDPTAIWSFFSSTRMHGMLCGRRWIKISLPFFKVIPYTGMHCRSQSTTIAVFTKNQCFRKIPKDSESFGIIRLTSLFYRGFGTRNTILRKKNCLKWHYRTETICKHFIIERPIAESFRNFWNVLETFGNQNPSWKRPISNYW